jgi:hypothetical protein
MLIEGYEAPTQTGGCDLEIDFCPSNDDCDDAGSCRYSMWPSANLRDKRCLAFEAVRVDWAVKSVIMVLDRSSRAMYRG